VTSGAIRPPARAATGLDPTVEASSRRRIAVVFAATPGAGTKEGMSRPPESGPSSRSAAVGELFAALEGLMISYHALPEAEREQRWNHDAELITGAVALHLSTARARIAARRRTA
jgi:hypothetical protein